MLGEKKAQGAVGRQVRTDQAERSFKGKVALELEPEGCLAVHEAEKRRGVLTSGKCAKARVHIPLGKRLIFCLQVRARE